MLVTKLQKTITAERDIHPVMQMSEQPKTRQVHC